MGTTKSGVIGVKHINKKATNKPYVQAETCESLREAGQAPVAVINYNGEQALAADYKVEIGFGSLDIYHANIWLIEKDKVIVDHEYTGADFIKWTSVDVKFQEALQHATA